MITHAAQTPLSTAISDWPYINMRSNAVSSVSAEAVIQETTSVKSLSLRRNFSWTFVGNVVYAASSWAMLVVLAKLGTPEKVGQFALGLAVTAPVIMLTNLQLRAVQATDAKRDYRFADYLTLRLVMVLLAGVVIAGIAFLSGYALETALVVFAIGVGKCFDAISDVYYGFLQQHERMDRIAKSNMAKGVLSLAMLAGAMILTGSVLWSALAWSAASLIVLLAYDLRSQRVAATNDEPLRRPDARTLWTLARLALPLGVTMMLISLNSNIPRYFLEWHGGEYAVGIYASMAYLMVAGTAVVGALGQSASPRLARYFAAGDGQAFRQLLGRLFLIALALGAAGVLSAVVAGKPVLNLLYGPEYAAESTAFVWIMAAAALSYLSSVLGYGLTASRKFDVQLPINLLSTGAVAAIAAWLIPAHGINGAATANLASFVILIAFKVLILSTTVLPSRQK